jgi:hypothetical protein
MRVISPPTIPCRSWPWLAVAGEAGVLVPPYSMRCMANAEGAAAASPNTEMVRPARIVANALKASHILSFR